MTLRKIREQLGALREEIARITRPEWLSIKVPYTATDEAIEGWLTAEIGADWRLHVIVWFGDTECDRPVVVSRMPVPRVDSGFTLRFSAADAVVL